MLIKISNKVLCDTQPYLYSVIVFFISFTLMSCDNRIDDYIEKWTDRDEPVCDSDISSVDFKRVAYWSDSDNDTLKDIDFSMLTHIIYSTVQVNEEGSIIPLDEDSEFEDMISRAKNTGVYAMMSIEGINDNTFNQIASDKGLLKVFINNLKNFVDEYGVEGVDIDWRYPEGLDEGKRFKELILSVEDYTKNKGILLSYIVGMDANGYSDKGIRDSTLNYGDFINVIVLGGSNNTFSAQQYFNEAINYWANRCVEKNRIVPMLPLYSQGDASLDYRTIIKDNKNNACSDYARNIKDEQRVQYSVVYYNSVPTIIDKTRYAQEYAGGIGLENLAQDYFDDLSYSVIGVVNEVSSGYTPSICIYKLSTEHFSVTDEK